MEKRIAAMLPILNEKQRRIFLASEAKAYGRGGISLASKISGVSRTTIRAGMVELEGGKTIDISRVRRAGGGRKFVEDIVPDIQERIQEIVDSATYGNPERVLSWTTESLRKIQAKLKNSYSISVSFKTVGAILEDLGYSKQANQKMLQIGEPHPDRNAQFEFIDRKAKEFIDAGEPVISVDAKRKKTSGISRMGGRNTARQKTRGEFSTMTFRSMSLGKLHLMGYIT